MSPQSLSQNIALRLCEIALGSLGEGAEFLQQLLLGRWNPQQIMAPHSAYLASFVS
ncbi:MAG: hypothetical protein OXL68_21815 [Paracoccaceae bacterium]|nr:hypothetical protein [Paracoccaceae bacterium]